MGHARAPPAPTLGWGLCRGGTAGQPAPGEQLRAWHGRSDAPMLQTTALGARPHPIGNRYLTPTQRTRSGDTHPPHLHQGTLGPGRGRTAPTPCCPPGPRSPPPALGEGRSRGGCSAGQGWRQRLEPPPTHPARSPQSTAPRPPKQQPPAPLPRRAVTGTNPAPARDPAGPQEMVAERGPPPAPSRHRRGAGSHPG